MHSNNDVRYSEVDHAATVDPSQEPVTAEPQTGTGPDVLQNVRGCYNSGDEFEGQPTGKLTDRQRIAIELILLGASDRIVAGKLGVHRVTVTRWRLKNATFAAELERRREMTWGATSNRVGTMLDRALNVLANEMAHPDPLLAHRAARDVLAMSHRFKPPRSTEYGDY